MRTVFALLFFSVFSLGCDSDAGVGPSSGSDAGAAACEQLEDGRYRSTMVQESGNCLEDGDAVETVFDISPPPSADADAGSEDPDCYSRFVFDESDCSYSLDEGCDVDGTVYYRESKGKIDVVSPTMAMGTSDVSLYFSDTRQIDCSSIMSVTWEKL